MGREELDPMGAEAAEGAEEAVALEYEDVDYVEAPAVTILVPIYNNARYLRECLDSLRSQSYVDFEAILLNDGSTDASGAIAHEYEVADPRFRVVDKPNSGYGATLNIGLSQATGTYVGFLESDDAMCDGALERLMTVVEAYDADIARGSYALYWSEGPHGPREQVLHPYAEDMTNRALDPRDEPRVFLYKSAIWCGVYRREMLVDNAISFLETPGASYQDTSFAFKTYASAESAVFFDEPIIRYRQDNEASSVRSRGKVYAVRKEFDEIDRWLARRGDDAHAAILRRASVVARLNAYLWNVDRIAPEYRDEFIHSISLEFSKMDDAGRIDWEGLDSWRALNIRKIIDNPDRYLRLRESVHGQSALSKAAFSLELGGVGALVGALRERRDR